jgi:hypothetical protein
MYAAFNPVINYVYKEHKTRLYVITMDGLNINAQQPK